MGDGGRENSEEFHRKCLMKQTVSDVHISSCPAPAVASGGNGDSFLQLGKREERGKGSSCSRELFLSLLHFRLTVQAGGCKLIARPVEGKRGWATWMNRVSVELQNCVLICKEPEVLSSLVSVWIQVRGGCVCVCQELGKGTFVCGSEEVLSSQRHPKSSSSADIV